MTAPALRQAGTGLDREVLAAIAATAARRGVCGRAARKGDAAKAPPCPTAGGSRPDYRIHGHQVHFGDVGND